MAVRIRTLFGHVITATFHVERSICRRIVRSSPVLTRSDVRGVPLRPVVLGSGRLMVAALEMEHLTNVGSVSDKLDSCRLDVVDDEERSLN